MTSTENKAVKRPIYEESSQYRHWRFSAAQLWEIREASNRAAVERVKQNFQEEMQVANGNSSEKSEDMRYLTVQDELALCQFYEKQLQGICRHLKFTDAVMATAVMYMKRFFLYNTVMDYHPKDILLTCLFLSTKSESERISIDQFGKSLKLPSTDTVLKLEFTVSQGLKFEFLVHHPYRPAYGFFLDMQTLGIEHKTLLETYNKVKQQVIPNILLTDLPLIYQPSQLALAAFMIAGKDKLEKQILQYMETRLGSEDAKATRQVMDEIAKVVSELKPVTPDEAKVIDRRLRVCLNPAKNPDSALYKKRAAEEDEDRRKKKARLEEESDEDDSDDGSL